MSVIFAKLCQLYKVPLGETLSPEELNRRYVELSLGDEQELCHLGHRLLSVPNLVKYCHECVNDEQFLDLLDRLNRYECDQFGFK